MSTSIKQSGTKPALLSLAAQRIGDKVRVWLIRYASKLQAQSDKLSRMQQKVILVFITFFWVVDCVLITVSSVIDTGEFPLSITPVQIPAANNLNVPDRIIANPDLPGYRGISNYSCLDSTRLNPSELRLRPDLLDSLKQTQNLFLKQQKICHGKNNTFTKVPETKKISYGASSTRAAISNDDILGITWRDSQTGFGSTKNASRFKY